MAQQASREAQITIGDQSYRVSFSILAIVSLRDHWKLETDDEVLMRLDQMGKEAGRKEGRKIDFRAVADLLWAGLRRYHPEVTPEESLVLLSDAGLDGAPAIMQAIFGSLAAAAPPQGVRQTRPPKKVNGRSASTS